MKLVTTTIPEHVPDDLRDTLLAVGIKEMTISAATRRSPDETDAEFDRSGSCVFENELEIGLETVVSVAIVDEVVKAISAACNEAAMRHFHFGFGCDPWCPIRNSELVTEG
jgi:nitrogen regulatory protein PII